MPCRVRSFVTGEKQALILTKTQPFYELPDNVQKLIGAVDIPDQVGTFTMSYVVTASGKGILSLTLWSEVCTIHCLKQYVCCLVVVLLTCSQCLLLKTFCTVTLMCCNMFSTILSKIAGTTVYHSPPYGMRYIPYIPFGIQYGIWLWKIQKTSVGKQ